MRLKMRLKKIVTIIFLALCILIIGCKQITQEEAIDITKDFVNSKVKFFVNEENASSTVNRASITVKDIKKLDFEATGKKIPSWNIFLNIRSNQTGQVKQSDLLVIIDARNGEILNWGKI